MLAFMVLIAKKMGFLHIETRPEAEVKSMKVLPAERSTTLSLASLRGVRCCQIRIKMQLQYLEVSL